MIEKIILDYLSNALSVPVYMEVPADKPQKYVTIEKTGGGEQNKIKTAMFAVQSHAQSMLDAAELSKDVCSAMENAVSVKNISRASASGDYNFTDTAKKEYRYQAVFDITYHE